MRLENINDLKERIENIFGRVDAKPEQMSNINDYGLMFLVQGKVKPLVESLKTQTDPGLWDGESVHWGYRNEEENFLLTLQSVPRAVLCSATVMSLHRKHVEQYLI